MICVPTGCGKKFFMKKFFKYMSQMTDVNFERILFYYSEWQPGYTEYGDKIEFREGLPESADFASDPRAKLIVIDDLVREASNKNIVDLFTKGSHHKNLSFIFIAQNLFHQGHGQRDISLNTIYIVVFKNPRDHAQIQHLARQIFPEKPRFLQEVYFDATSVPHGFLLLDLEQSTPDKCRFRACLFPDDQYNYVFVPRKEIKGRDAGRDVPVMRL